jgi:hypothetical protein
MRQLTSVLLTLLMCGASTLAVQDAVTKSRQAGASADAYKKLAAAISESTKTGTQFVPRFKGIGFPKVKIDPSDWVLKTISS